MADPKLTGVDWDMINKDAESWAREFGGQLVKDIDKGTRRDVGNAVGDFYSEGHTMGELGDRLGRIYSPQRAERIAITEVTRAAAEGERGIAKELAKDGIVMVEVWQTRNDLVVCEICEPRNGVEEHKGDGDAYWDRSMGPPGHPNCRCNIRLDYEKTKEDAIQIEEAADFMEDISQVDPYERLQYEEIQASTERLHEMSDEEHYNINGWFNRGDDVHLGSVQGKTKDQICKEISRRSGLSYEQTNDMIKQWSHTSNKAPNSLQMQKRASEMFNAPMSDWQQAKYDSVMTPLEIADPMWSNAEVDRFLKAMYENTQDQLSRAGIETVKLQRGVQLESSDVYEIARATPPEGRVMLEENVMESWSISGGTAEDFGNVLFEADVPASRIIGTARTGFGCLGEYEFVVIGSPLDDYATLVSIDDFLLNVPGW